MRDERLVVISGAASGIGRATALAFASRGAALELLDVDTEGLGETQSQALTKGASAAVTTRVDVADDASVRAYSEQLSERNLTCDVLINNAGVLVAGGFLETEIEDWRYVFGVNLFGAVHLTRALLPRMIERRSGHVLNVASASAFWNPPPIVAYGSSKYALLGLSEALHGELRPHGIRVTAVCPGFVVTPIVDHMRLRGSFENADTREKARQYAEQRGVAPDVVANAIVHASTRDLGVLPVGREAWLLALGKRIFPSFVGRVAAASAARFARREH
jgi:NAD(P)-dependent dehydrogenase (short-subunit alcohol dehydrogenase family)